MMGHQCSPIFWRCSSFGTGRGARRTRFQREPHRWTRRLRGQGSADIGAPLWFGWTCCRVQIRSRRDAWRRCVGTMKKGAPPSSHRAGNTPCGSSCPTRSDQAWPGVTGTAAGSVEPRGSGTRSGSRRGSFRRQRTWHGRRHRRSPSPSRRVGWRSWGGALPRAGSRHT